MYEFVEDDQHISHHQSRYWRKRVMRKRWWHFAWRCKHYVHVDKTGSVNLLSPPPELADLEDQEIIEWIRTNLQTRVELYLNRVVEFPPASPGHRPSLTMPARTESYFISAKFPTAKEAMMFKLAFGGKYQTVAAMQKA